MMKKIHYKSAQEISTVEPATSRCQNCPKMAPQKRRNISCIYSLCRDSCLRCFYLAQSAPLSLPLAHFLKNFPDPVVHLSNQMPPRTFPQVLRTPDSHIYLLSCSHILFPHLLLIHLPLIMSPVLQHV